MDHTLFRRSLLVLAQNLMLIPKQWFLLCTPASLCMGRLTEAQLQMFWLLNSCVQMPDTSYFWAGEVGRGSYSAWKSSFVAVFELPGSKVHDDCSFCHDGGNGRQRGHGWRHHVGGHVGAFARSRRDWRDSNPRHPHQHRTAHQTLLWEGAFSSHGESTL